MKYEKKEKKRTIKEKEPFQIIIQENISSSLMKHYISY